MSMVVMVIFINIAMLIVGLVLTAKSRGKCFYVSTVLDVKPSSFNPMQANRRLTFRRIPVSLDCITALQCIS